MVRLEAAIAERAQRQLGLTTICQLETLGCTRGQRRHLVDAGFLTRLPGGVFAIAGMPASWRRDVLAGVWAAGDGAVASHRAAARLWRFEGRLPFEVDVTVARGRRPRAVPGRLWRSADLANTDVTSIGAIPVTTKVRTLIDLPGVAPLTACQSAVDAALRDRVVTHDQLATRAKELLQAGRRGPGDLLRLLGEDRALGGRPESWLERAFLDIVVGAGLPLPVIQHVAITSGKAVRVDFAYQREKLVIEVLGHRTHSTRAQLRADAERARRLTARGWRVVQFTYDEITAAPGAVADEVRLLLGL